MWFRLPISANSGISRGVAALAQPVEHRFRKAGVRCSSHLSGTIYQISQYLFEMVSPFGGRLLALVYLAFYLKFKIDRILTASTD